MIDFMDSILSLFKKKTTKNFLDPTKRPYNFGCNILFVVVNLVNLEK